MNLKYQVLECDLLLNGLDYLAINILPLVG